MPEKGSDSPIRAWQRERWGFSAVKLGPQPHKKKKKKYSVTRGHVPAPLRFLRSAHARPHPTSPRAHEHGYAEEGAEYRVLGMNQLHGHGLVQDVAEALEEASPDASPGSCRP